MAVYIRTKYEDDQGVIHPIRLSPEIAAEAGTEPTAAVGSNIKAKVSKGNREFGLRPRGRRLARLVGTGNDAFYKYSFLPLRSIADNAGTSYAIGETIEIGGVSWQIIEEIKEDY